MKERLFVLSSEGEPEETEEVNGVLWPKWAVEDARWVVERSGNMLESAIESVLAIEKARQNVKKADPDEPVRAIFKGNKK